MGFFSWHTNDTQKPIMNHWSGKNFPVYMIDDKGNSWYEKEYEGYGVFGGKDYYELLAEMNGLASDRELGIALAHSPQEHITPNFVTDLNLDWVDEKPKDHIGQGHWST